MTTFYNSYDYSTFWEGRDYENVADRIAVKRLLQSIPQPHEHIIDVGGGIGRLAPLYKDSWRHVTILDSSRDQLAAARKRLSDHTNVDFVEGPADAIPLPSASCDAALCVRMFHYVEHPQRVITEIKRILSPGGYLILEIPNKIHFKARLARSARRHNLSSHEPVSRSKHNHDVLFLNHHPMAIRKALVAERFEIVTTLSVSNFRHAFFKRVVPPRLLKFFEKLLQPALARLWFGPSIYFLARKQ